MATMKDFTTRGGNDIYGEKGSFISIFERKGGEFPYFSTSLFLKVPISSPFYNGKL